MSGSRACPGALPICTSSSTAATRAGSSTRTCPKPPADATSAAASSRPRRVGSPLDKGYALLASSRFSLQSATGWFTSLGAEHSAFTGSLIELIRSWSKDDDLPTYTELSVLLEARMRRLEFAQQPQVAGDTDRVLLGSGEWRRPSRRLARVRSPNQLEEGAAHGVVVGSRWVVLKAFAETEDPIRHLDDPVATVQVVKVQDFSSDFVVVEPAGLSQVDDDSLAIEIGRPPAADQRLVVGIPAAVRRRTAQATRIGAVRERLSSSPLLDVRVAPSDDDQVDVFSAAAEAASTCSSAVSRRGHTSLASS